MMIRGSKGGGQQPQDAADTLRSVQRGEIVDLLGEGEIGGLVNGAKSIYLDGVPVENADGSRNFAEFGFTLMTGGPGDTAAPHDFGDVQTEVAVGVTVLAAVPVVRTIADTTVDAIRVTLTGPTLVKTEDNGDRVGASFQFAIDVQSNGGGYVQRFTDSVSGKATSAYSRSIKLDLTATGPAPWDVRVRRITADSTSSNLVDAFAWSSYTAISGVRMLYRNSAFAQISFDSKNFSQIPVRGYDVMGISDWDFPSNYDALARTYTGSWSGVFTQGWTNNPAWVLYNLVQHPRYGLGQYITQLPDKWVLYELAQWCDEQLPDGRGGTEPRYSVNAYIQQQSEAVRLLQDICAVFRGALLYGGSTLAVSWDAPRTPVASYAPANVVDGLFTYSDGSAAAKKSSCTCWYTDRSQLGKRVPATWDDADLVAKYGLRSMEIDPIGVATPAQALRMAKWALYTTEVEDKTVAFRLGAQGAAGRIGEVFQISDPAETGERLSGRVHAATTGTVTLDAPVTLLGGETYTLWVTVADAADPTRLALQSRTVTTAAGQQTTLAVAPAFTAAPTTETMWLLEGSTVQPTLWRYQAISEQRNKDAALEYEVVGVWHDPSKWGKIEADQPLTPRPTRRLSDAAPAPAALNLAEGSYLDGGVARVRVSASWLAPAAGLRYELAWRSNNGPWTTLPLTSANTVDVDGVQPGEFEAVVQSVNALGNVSAPTSATLTVLGWATNPGRVEAFAVTFVPGGARLSWKRCAEANYLHTELHFEPSWNDATVPRFRGDATEWFLPWPADGSYAVLAKHKNTSKLYSTDAARISFTVAGTVVTDCTATWLADGGDTAGWLADVLDPESEEVTGYAPATWLAEPLDLSLLWSTVGGAGRPEDNATANPVYRQTLEPVGAPDGAIWLQTDEFGAVIASWVKQGGVFVAGPLGASVDIQYSVDGATLWHSTFTPGDLYARQRRLPADWSAAFRIVGEDGSDGAYTDYRFQRSATLPATPTGDTPTGWPDAPPAADGNALWMIKGSKTAAGALTGAWSTPVRLDGVDGAALSVEYSIDGATLWHSTFATGDIYMRQRTGSGSWSGAIRIVGETGAGGNYTDYRFKRAATAPGTPTGDTPSGWTDAPPAADGNPLWMIKGSKTAAGVLIGTWSAPVRLDGADGAAGPRGPVEIAYAITGTAWSDTLAQSALTAGGYGAPQYFDRVTLYKTAAAFSETRIYSGTAWLTITAYINGNMVVNGTLLGDAFIADTLIVRSTSNLGDATVSTLKIGSEQVTIPRTVFDSTLFTGNNAYQTALSYTFSLGAAAPVIVIWNAEQGFTSTTSTDFIFRAEFYLNGSLIGYTRGGETAQDSPGTSVFGDGVSGSNTIVVKWRGTTYAQVGNQKLIVLGAMR